MLSVDQWIATAAAIATIVAAIVAGLLARSRRIRDREREAMQINTKASVATGDIHFNFHAAPSPPRPPVTSTPAIEHIPESVVVAPRAPPPPVALQLSGAPEAPEKAEVDEADELVFVESWPACDSGPYDVEPGADTKVELDVDSGHRVEGHLDADADFEFELLNAPNYARMRRGERYSVAREGGGESVYLINWKVRGKGPWFLIMRAYGKRKAREVEVSLTATQT